MAASKLLLILLMLAFMLALGNALRYRLLLTTNSNGGEQYEANAGALSDHSTDNAMATGAGSSKQNWQSGPLNSRFSRPRRIKMLYSDDSDEDNDYIGEDEEMLA